MKPRMRNAIKISALCFGLGCVITTFLFGILCVGMSIYWMSDAYKEVAPRPLDEVDLDVDNHWDGWENLSAPFYVIALPLLGPIWAGTVLLVCLAVNFYRSSSLPSQRMGHAVKKTVLFIAITVGAVTLLSSIAAGIGWIKWPGETTSFVYMLVHHGFRVITQIWVGVAMLVFLVVGFYHSSSEEDGSDGGAPS